MSKIYVYSTLTADQIYTNYGKSENGVPRPISEIKIAGGANLMTKALVTPRGAVTEVTAEQLAELQKNEVFKLHKSNGFISVSESKTDPEKAAADMEGRDQSAPLVEQDDIQAPAEDEDKPKRGRPRSK